MTRTCSDAHQKRAQMFKALGHPSRLRIMEAIGRGERCVSDLQGQVGSDISTVSKHLTVLREAGLIASEKRGLQVYYRLSCLCILNLFECLDDVVKESRVLDV